jgi:hypothetical protein
MKTQEIHAKIVTSTLEMTENTAISPSYYELHLLEKYVLGMLTIEEFLALLEHPVFTPNK